MTHWDIAGRRLVVGAGTKLMVSDDAGDTWRAWPLPDGSGQLEQLFVRPDGRVAIATGSGPDRAFYSAAGPSEPWQRTELTPSGLRRIGSWVWNGDHACPAVLTRGGQWSADPDLSGLPGYKDPRDQILTLGHQATRIESDPEAMGVSQPPTGRPGAMHTERIARCLDPIGSLKPRPQGPELRTQPMTPCQGLGCLARQARRPQAKPGRWVTMLVQDGAPGRPAHLAQIDRKQETIDISQAPKGCEPVATAVVATRQWLACEQGVWVRRGQEAWAQELALKQAPRLAGVSMGPDGTGIWHGRCDRQGACADSFVRRPDASWWRVPGAWDVLALGTGEVLVAGPRGVWVSRGGGRAWVRPRVESAVRGLRVGDKGEVQADVGSGMRPEWVPLFGKSTT